MPQTLTLSELNQHRILIVGLAREGLSTYRFVRSHFPDLELWLSDDKSLTELGSDWGHLLDQDTHAHFVPPDQALATTQPTLIFKTPGLPPRHALILAAQEQQLQITSNTQLFFDLLSQVPDLRQRFEVVGITGTKGKSTTSALIYHLCQTAGLPALLGGNIGVPPLDIWSQLPLAETSQPAPFPFKIILELSCHQLADLHSSPMIAVIQNIVPEHLDYYATFEEYVAAKSQITRFQTPEDYVIFNPAFEQPTKLAQLSPAHQLWFSHLWQPQLSAFVRDGQLWLQDSSSGQQTSLMGTTELPLKGEHNLQNVMPSLVLAQHWQINSEVLKSALKSFKALEHRLEFVAEVKGVQYYNDSMSTMPAATMGAVQAFPDHPLILIAGGHERHLEFTDLGRELAQTARLKKLVLFKPTGEHILAAYLQAGGQVPHVFASTMAEAVAAATNVAEPGDVVLMSPASASFGIFKDYRDRGNQFKDQVRHLS